VSKIPAAPKGGTTVVVRVLTERGRPIPGATVEMVGLRGRPHPEDPDAVWRSTENKTDADGEKWWQLSPKELAELDKVTVRAWKDRYRPADSTKPGYDPADGASAQQAINRDGETVIELRLKSCCLATYVDLKEGTPARALTPEEARDVLFALHQKGEITLRVEPEFGDPTGRETPQPSPACGGCVPRNYLIGPHPSNSAAERSIYLSMERKVGGVEWVYVGEYKDVVQFWATPGFGAIQNVEARLAVALYRLTRFLRDSRHVTRIYHIGIGQGQGANTDPHNTGRAIDFGGVTMVDPKVNGGASTSFHVYYDWFSHPTTWPVAPTDATRKKGEGVRTTVPNLKLADPEQRETKRLADWPPDWGTSPGGNPLPGGVNPLQYRLRRAAPDAAGSVYPAGVCPTASDLWLAVYVFAAGQFENKSVGADATEAPAGVGARSWIMSPDCAPSDPPPADAKPGDKPPPHGRQAHNNHFHFQIGK
jgi:hypothetical protein